MSIIRFDNGTTVKFDGIPTSADVEELAFKLGLNKPITSGKEKLNNVGVGVGQSIVGAGTGALTNLFSLGRSIQAGLDPRNTKAQLEAKAGPTSRAFISGTPENKKITQQLTPKNKYQQYGKLGGDIAQFFGSGMAGNALGSAKTVAQLPRFSQFVMRYVLPTALDTGLAYSQGKGAGMEGTDLGKFVGTTALTSGFGNALLPPGGPALSKMQLIARSGLTGYTGDVATGLAGLRGEDRTGTKAFIPGIGTGTGLALGTGIAGLQKGGELFTTRGQATRTEAKRWEQLSQLERDRPKFFDALADARKAGVDDPIGFFSQTRYLNDSVDGKGTVKTEKGRQMLRQDVLNPYGKFVRDTLVKDKDSVTISDLKRAMVEAYITSDIPGEARLTLRKSLEREIKGLAEKTDSSGRIPLYLVHDAKTFRYDHTNFKDPTAQAVSKDVGRFLKETIERHARNLDVKAYNEQLAGFYALDEVLKSLNGAKVEGGRLGTHISTLLGAYLGGQLGSPLTAGAGAIGARKLNQMRLAGALGGKQTKGADTSKLSALQKAQYEKAPIVVPRYNPKGLPEPLKVQSLKSKSPVTNQKTKSTPKIANTDIDQNVPQRDGIVKKVVRSVKESLKNPSIGLATKDVTKGVPVDETVRVGLSPVKGTVRGKYDDLVDEADKLFAEGNFNEAFKKYTQIAQGAQKTVQDKFKRTNIKVKFSGVDFGVYEGVPEPTIGFSATVKPEDMDLFHQILTDLSERDFNQHSFVTYKQSLLKRDVPYGIVDKAKGTSEEPHFIFTTETPLTLADIKTVNEALADAELPAMSIKEGGRRIDILHLTGYDKDYENFVNKIHDFKKNLDSKGIAGTSQFARAEVRFVGDKGSSANTTYKRSRSDFYKKNTSFVKPDTIESKVLDAIRYKPSISKKELESIVNSGEVSPTEKAVFRDVLNEMKDGQVKGVEVQQRLRGKLLTLTGEEANAYVNYGWDNVLRGDYEGTAVVFDSNFKHGKGKNHYDAEGLFGHARFARGEDRISMVKDGKRIGTKVGKVALIGELQSDFFQHDANIDLFKDPDKFYQFTKDRIIQLESNVNSINRELADKSITWLPSVKQERLRGLKRDKELVTELKRQIEPLEIERKLRHTKNKLEAFQEETDPSRGYNPPLNVQIQFLKNDIERLEAEAKAKPVKPNVIQEQFLNFARSNQYRQRLFEETIDYIMKIYKPDEIRVAKPSMVAKIEGYMSAGDDMAPYELPNGRFGQGADDLTPGDEIGVMGEPWTVVGLEAQGRGWGGPPPTDIVVAPADNVHSFRLSEHIDSGVQFRMEEGTYILKDVANDAVLTKAQLEEVADGSWPVDRVAMDFLENISSFGTDYPTKSEFISVAENKVRVAIEENVWDDLRDIYGDDHVFSDYRGNDPLVYVVDDDAQPERYSQPSAYASNEDALSLDEGPQNARDLPDYAQSVLNNYYELHNKIIPKYEQKIGQKFTDGEIEDSYGNPSGYASFQPDYSRSLPPKKTF